MHGFRPVAGRGHDFDVPLAAEDRPESGPDQGLIVGEQDPDHVRASRVALVGNQACTRKPPSATGAAVNRPPTDPARSAMPRMPLPERIRLASIGSAVVHDLDFHRGTGPAKVHDDVRGSGVPQDAGQRFLHDPASGEVDGRRQAAWRVAGEPYPQNGRLGMRDQVNGRDMEMTRIDEVVPAGAHEVWELNNTTNAHNFHIHEVPFRILEINGAAPPAYQQGPKDTVFIPKKAKVRLAARFGTYTDPASPYMYHCHILRHEDKGMMGQFVVVEPGTEQRVPRTIGHGHI